MKHTVHSRFEHDIHDLLTDGHMPQDNYREALKTSHSTAVESYLANIPPNTVLEEPPPQISPDENLLARSARNALSQLRSGFCSALANYRFRIGISEDQSCSECGAAVQNTAHLFTCPSHPTALSCESLWTDPSGCAAFLSSFPCFSYLLPVQRPPPEPPP